MTGAVWECAHCPQVITGVAADLVAHCEAAHGGSLWSVERSCGVELVVEWLPGVAETVVAA